MLVLQRMRDESIILGLEDGREIAVSVVDIRGDRVRLGVTADKAIRVDRYEISQVRKQEQAAAQAAYAAALGQAMKRE